MTWPASDAVWTDTRVERLRALWKDGLSASQIAVALGGVTRNGVIGKVHRLGLSGRVRAAPRVARLRPPPEKHQVRRAVKMGNRFDVVDGVECALPAELPAADIPLEQRKTLLELTNETCRFPYGDPGKDGFFFCGALEADLSEGRPYCRFHRLRASGGLPRQRSPETAPRWMAA